MEKKKAECLVVSEKVGRVFVAGLGVVGLV